MTVADERTTWPTTMPLSRSESARSRRLAKHYLTRTAGDNARLQRTVSLAARAMDFPIGQINIIDDQFLYTIGDYGSGATLIRREDSMCHFLVDDGAPVLAVDDLRQEERYRQLPAVRNGTAQSYLGVPLRGREASTVGTLCVVGDQPRHVTVADIERIVEFGEIVEDQLDLVRRSAETPASREISAQVAQALQAGDMVPWYQPIVHLATGTRVSFEALARWNGPDGVVVDPATFVGTAEDSDLVIDLDRAIVIAALRDLARWRAVEPRLRLNVNLSTRHLELSDGADFVITAAAEAGVEPSAVIIEITETRVLCDLTRAASTVCVLQAAGFRVVLDDFANGWSGLDWLLSLGANGLKIDRTLATALGTRVGDAVSRAVIGMATELGISTTIEGIGDAEQLAAARRHGFRYGQGYFWSPPVPAGVVDGLL